MVKRLNGHLGETWSFVKVQLYFYLQIIKTAHFNVVHT